MNLTIIEAIKQKYNISFFYQNDCLYKICPWIYGVYIDEEDDRSSVLGLVIERNNANIIDIRRFYDDRITELSIVGGNFKFPSSKRFSQWKKIYIEI